jgi:hypothetical protein
MLAVVYSVSRQRARAVCIMPGCHAGWADVAAVHAHLAAGPAATEPVLLAGTSRGTCPAAGCRQWPALTATTQEVYKSCRDALRADSDTIGRIQPMPSEGRQSWHYDIPTSLRTRRLDQGTDQ